MRKLSEPPSEDFDDHNAPTEPMSAIILSPRSVPTYSIGGGNGVVGYNQPTIPAPLPPEIPFPQNGQPGPSYAYAPEASHVYPVLPPAPAVHGNGGSRPPGGAAPFAERAKPFSSNPRRSSFPTFVGMLFVLAQLILLVRVVLLLFSVSSASNIGVELLYASGALLAWPLHVLLDHLNLPTQIGGDLINYLAALIAILLYGVVARILVRFLKAVLNSR